MSGEKSAPRSLFRALRHRNYQLFFAGQTISLIGTWLTKVATSWLVYRLVRDDPTQSAPRVLGWVGFAGQLPILLLAPLAGAIVDRYSRHRMLFATQILSTLQSAALAVLSLLGIITIPQVLWLCVFQGLINALDNPARQSFLVEIIEERADLPNAIALNSSMFNGARLFGPAIGGLLIARYGEGVCFSVDTISYLAVLAALGAMTIPKAPARAKPRAFFSEIRDGITYTFGFAPTRAILTLVALLSFLTVPFMTLMPILADRLTHVSGHGAQTVGFLLGSSGIGALAASVYLASRAGLIGLGRVIVGACLLLGAGLIIFSRSHMLWLSMCAMLLVGFGMIVSLAGSNTILQTIVPDEKRGRVMSFYNMAFLGTAPLGSLAGGELAGAFGEESTVLFSGIGALCCGLLFSMQLPGLRKLIRPIYSSKGILPAVATGVQAATDLTTPPEN